MSKETPIEWCDSSLNLQMGCDGCELWTGKVKKCYAGRQTEGRGGFKGWPKSFGEPELFLDRLEPALKWADLTGLERPEKPWLDGLPRLIFLNDMGDTFSKALPQNWLAPLLPRLASSPHHFLLLTKRPSKLFEFADKHPLPPNLWPGTSVTSQGTAGRAEIIRKIKSGGPKFLSCEPLWSGLTPETFAGMQWVIFGGESGERRESSGHVSPIEATPANMEWMVLGSAAAQAMGAKVFVKQLGTNPFFMEGEAEVPLELEDEHGREWNQWPMILRVRQMPALSFEAQPSLL